MKVDQELLEELAPEMYAIIKALVKNYQYDYWSCINDMRKETNGCPSCRAIDAGAQLIAYIEDKSDALLP